MLKADLHIHTTASDGVNSPAEVVREAADLALSSIAITDHDTIAGLPAAREQAQALGLQCLNGVEITSSFNNRDCHLLAYCFNLQNSRFLGLLNTHKQRRIDRAGRIINKLNRQGLDIDLNEVLAEANGSTVGRPHIARVLCDKGFVASKKEAFIRYLSDKKIDDISTHYIHCREVIETVHQAGGVAVIAHPGRLYSLKELEQLIAFDMDGIEAVHPSHHTDMEMAMRDLAENHGLFVTGGSDFHGKRKTDFQNFGSVGITAKELRMMMDAADQQKISA